MEARIAKHGWETVANARPRLPTAILPFQLTPPEFDTVCTIPPCGASLGDGRRGSSMVEKPADRSRRELMRAVVTGVPLGLLLRISRTEASEKMTRQHAEYQDAPKDIYSCGMCTLFEPPKYCKVVEGEVSKDGWCKAFVLAD
jgi:hypothetical protein